MPGSNLVVLKVGHSSHTFLVIDLIYIVKKKVNSYYQENEPLALDKLERPFFIQVQYKIDLMNIKITIVTKFRFNFIILKKNVQNEVKFQRYGSVVVALRFFLALTLVISFEKPLHTISQEKARGKY